MDKTSKIFLCIIILLALVIGYLVYKVNYFKNGYLKAANALCNQTKLLEDSGIEIISENNNPPQIHLKDTNKVIIEQ